MFDEPEEPQEERAFDPEARVKDRSDEFRMHAELCAVFEGTRKFEAQIITGLNPEITRDIQRTIGKLEKLKLPDTPVISPEGMPHAERLLDLPASAKLSTNDYHIHRRPGETMIVRFLEAEQVDSFYERLQAHCDAALQQLREDERGNLEWKQDPDAMKYIEALDALEINMPERYLRPLIKQHNLCVLSTQSADELDITHLTDYIMGAHAADVVGEASAPPEENTESDRAWFFKLFALRGIKEGIERMCFFAFLQKAEESW